MHSFLLLSQHIEMLHFPAKSQLREQTYVCMHVVPLTCAHTVYVFLSPSLLVCLSGCHLIYFQVFGAVHTLLGCKILETAAPINLLPLIREGKELHMCLLLRFTVGRLDM